MTAKDSRWFIEDAVRLLAQMRTLQLATVSAAGEPLASVAPFVVADGGIHVFLSALAGHTGNLRSVPRASVMVLRDEADCADAFARPRLTLSCSVGEEARDSDHWQRVMARMVEDFGETAAVVRDLPDFTLFRLTPLDGQVVSGFARARGVDRDALRGILAAAQGR